MDIFHTLAAARLIFILGIVNFVTAFLLLVSCRCLPGSKLIGKALMGNPFYRRFFTLHCYIWPVFWASVVVHAFFAVMFFGWPA